MLYQRRDSMFRGKRVVLRAFTDGDAEVMHRFVNDEATMRQMLAGMPYPSTLRDEMQWVGQQSSYTRGEYHFAVENEAGAFIGRCGLIRLDWKNRVAELGMMIGAPYQHQGYGSEALMLLCRFCFAQLNLNRLVVRVFAGHGAAIRCYEKAGFQREGLLREEVFRDGRYQDVLVMGLLQRECPDA